MSEEANMTDDRGREWQSATWDQIDAAVDTAGYREGFVKVFLEFRGAVLDDCPLDAKGRPEVVNQSNFARHFGIAISTFHRWLCQWGGSEWALEGERKEKAEAAKGRQGEKAKKKDRDALAQEVRRKVAETTGDFADKRAVRKADDDFWMIDVNTLLESNLPEAEKVAEVERWYVALDEEATMAQQAAEKLLTWLSAREAETAA